MKISFLLPPDASGQMHLDTPEIDLPEVPAVGDGIMLLLNNSEESRSFVIKNRMWFASGESLSFRGAMFDSVVLELVERHAPDDPATNVVRLITRAQR